MPRVRVQVRQARQARSVARRAELEEAIAYKQRERKELRRVAQEEQVIARGLHADCTLMAR